MNQATFVDYYRLIPMLNSGFYSVLTVLFYRGFLQKPFEL